VAEKRSEKAGGSSSTVAVEVAVAEDYINKP